MSPRQGFREIYRAYYPFVWSSLFRFGVPRDQLEDAVQETFLVAYRRRPSREDVPLRPWLYGIARRIASNHRRSATRRTRKTSAMRSDMRTASAQNLEGAYAALWELDRYMGSLGTRDRELFLLSELEGMSGPELAAALGTNLNTVYTRLRKLRHRFQAAELDVHVERVQAERPAASARRWAVLAPLLGQAPKTIAHGWFAWLSSKVALKTVGVVGLATAIGASTAVLAGRGNLQHEAPQEPASIDEHPTATAADVALVAESAERREPPETDAPVLPSAPMRRATPIAPSRTVDAPREDETQLAAQTAVLRDVASALRDHRAERAWSLLEELDAKFPHGDLQDLRAALRIETLCALGRTDDARRETARFQIRHDRSPLTRRVLRSCGAADDPDSTPQTESDDPGHHQDP